CCDLHSIYLVISLPLSSVLCVFTIYSLFFFFFLIIRPPPRSTLFPTRRSSDLHRGDCTRPLLERGILVLPQRLGQSIIEPSVGEDRKSTRLNSSHLGISYAVFCLKKKKNR